MRLFFPGTPPAFRRSISWFAVAGILAAATGPALAEDDLVLVSASVPSIEIEYSRLLENDAPGATIQSSTSPARGTLTTGVGKFIYTRNEAALNSAGVDSFNYLNQFGERHTVFLVLGLDAGTPNKAFQREQPGDLPACTLSTNWEIDAAVGGYTLSPQGSGCELLLSPNAGGLAPSLASIDTGSSTGPGGGHTEMVLDPGDFGPDPNRSGPKDNLIMAAIDKLAPAVFQFGVGEDDQGDLVGLIRYGSGTDNTYQQTAPVKVPNQLAPFTLGLTWWFGGPNSFSDGGIILSIDGEARAMVSNVNNQALQIRRVGWTLGPENFTGPNSTFTIRDPVIWQQVGGHVDLMPLFSDHGSDPANWDQLVNAGSISSFTNPPPQGQSPDPELELELPLLNGASTQLVDDFDENLTRYRARFEIATEGMVMPAWSSMTFFGAKPNPGAYPQLGVGAPFLLQLLNRPAVGYQVRARALDGGAIVSSAWLDLPGGSARAVIEVWWQAPTSLSHDDGSLVLIVDGQETVLDNLSGNNHFLREIRLGPYGATSNLDGSLIVDAFDSWK